MRKIAILFLIALVILTGGIAPHVLAQAERKAAKIKSQQLQKRDPRLSGKQMLKLKNRADEVRGSLRKDDLQGREGKRRELGQKR